MTDTKRELPADVAAFRAEIVEDFCIEEFTCDECGAAPTCPYAFDPYNTDGDCLAEK